MSESLSDTELGSESEIEEIETETESEESRESSAREGWEAVAGLIRHARGMSRLEALDSVLPHLPRGPQASAIEHALPNTNSLPTTLQASEKVALAMTRAEEVLEFV